MIIKTRRAICRAVGFLALLLALGFVGGMERELIAVGKGAAAGFEYLLASGVADGQREDHGTGVLGLAQGVVQGLAHGEGQVAPVAYEVEADVLLHEFGQFLPDEFQEKLEEEAHLGFRPLPVLLGEGIDRDVGDVLRPAGAHQLAHGVHTGKMALGARKSALAGPAAVAVHDHGDMLRLFVHGVAGCGRVGEGVAD